MKPITLEIKVVDDLIKAGDFFFYPPSKEWLKAVSIFDQFCFMVGDLGGVTSPYLVLPLRDLGGVCDGFYARALERVDNLEAAQKRKAFIFLPRQSGFKKFHYHRFGKVPFMLAPEFKWKHTLFLQEGVLDTLSTCLWSPCAMGVFSNAISSTQFDFIYNCYKEGFYKRIVIIRDNDVKDDGKFW